jgi:hypothetical protein
LLDGRVLFCSPAQWHCNAYRRDHYPLEQGHCGRCLFLIPKSIDISEIGLHVCNVLLISGKAQARNRERVGRQVQYQKGKRRRVRGGAFIRPLTPPRFSHALLSTAFDAEDGSRSKSASPSASLSHPYPGTPSSARLGSPLLAAHCAHPSVIGRKRHCKFNQQRHPKHTILET